MVNGFMRAIDCTTVSPSFSGNSCAGAGTISPAGALNYKMNAQLAGGGAVGGLTQMAGIGGGGKGVGAGGGTGGGDWGWGRGWG